MRRALFCCLLLSCSTKTGELDPGQLPRLTAQPSEVNFGPVAVGAVAEQIVALINDSGDTIEPLLLPGSVGPCGAEPGAFCVAQPPSPIPAGNTGALTVRFSPSRTGPSNEILLLGACSASGCETPVALNGEGVAGRLVCEALEQDLGQLSLTTCAQGTITCTNRGQVETELRNVSLSPQPGFRLFEQAVDRDRPRLLIRPRERHHHFHGRSINSELNRRPVRKQSLQSLIDD